MRAPMIVKKDNDVFTIKLLHDSLVWPNVEKFDQQFSMLARERDWRKLLLDFDDVSVLTGAALGKLVSLREKLKTAGRKLILHNVSPDVYEIFKVTQLSRIFDIRTTPRDRLV